MSVEITFGGTCRDISKLPASEAERKTYFMETLAPAMWTDFSKNLAMVQGNGDGRREVVIGLAERGCEVSGSVTIKF